MSLSFADLEILSPSASLLVLLVSGHVLADFLVQTESVAARKASQATALIQHVVLTVVTHALLLFPFWSRNLVVPLLALGIYHLAVDFTKGRLDRRSSRRHQLRLFLADQGMHALGLLAVWAWLRDLGVAGTSPFLISAAVLSPLAGWSLVAAGLVFNGKGGTAVVRSLLERYPSLVKGTTGVTDGADDDEPTADGEYEMGRTIGVLERWIVYLLVLVGQWGALGLVLAAKSIARFPELKSQRFADYYLMGTLASILTAMITAMAVKLAVS